MVEQLLGHREHHDTHGPVYKKYQGVCTEQPERCTRETSPPVESSNEVLHHGYKQAKVEFKKCLMGYFRNVGLRSRIVHDVWELPGDGMAGRIRPALISAIRQGVSKMSGGNGEQFGSGNGGRNASQKGRGVFFITEHQDHIHVIHDCTYSGGSCRCRFMRFISECTTTETEECSVSRSPWINTERTLDLEIEDDLEKLNVGLGEASQGSNRGESSNLRFRRLRRYARRSSPAAMLTPEHWVHLAEYMFKAPRAAYYFEIAGRAWYQDGKVRNLSLLRLLEEAQKRVVEDSAAEKSIPDLFRRLACGQTGGPADQGDIQADTSNKECGNRDKVCRLQKWLEGYIITPPQNIFYTGHWCEGPFKYWSKQHDLIKNSFHNIRQLICDMSVKDIFLKTRNIPMERLIYVGPWNNLNEYYYEIRQSVLVLENVLKHQYPDSVDRKNFVQRCYQIVDKKLPKRNCLFILGEANSGKNYFFDCLCHCLINFGCMGNFNKYSNFPLQECVQRRIIQWNEPNFEPGSEETLKLIFGGDTCNVKVKYLSDACMLRTPIIVLSNNDCFPKSEAFRSRMFNEHWVRAPFLKHYKKKPHPLAMFYIFIKYKCMSMSTLENWERDLINTQ
uniref:Putative nonstructural protein NS1 n=1 Tax=Periparus ater ambidensovirus TaxID=2794455 RepID=A0A8A4XCY3_9VIRU|nr:MAG: putative nonstructural protein NS1 [Periparus ater ambidensovirus]